MLFVATFPFGDEIIKPELGFPDFAPELDESTPTSISSIVSWDRLPLHCRYLFLRFLSNPSKLSKSTEETRTKSGPSFSPPIPVSIILQDVQSKKPITGMLTFGSKEISIKVPGTQCRNVLTNIENEQGVLRTEISFESYYPITIPSMSSYSETTLVLFTQKSSEVGYLTCNPSFLYNHPFPPFPIEFTDEAISMYGPVLERFITHLLSASKKKIPEMKLFYDEVLLNAFCEPETGHYATSTLKEISRIFQLCHYLYCINRLEEVEHWIKIHISGFPCKKDTTICQIRESMFPEDEGNTETHKNGSCLLERKKLKRILKYLHQIQPKNMLYSFYYQRLSFS